MKKKLFAFVLVLCMAAGIFTFAQADKLADVKASGKLVVGVNVGFPPYEFYYTDPETGVESLEGFDIKLAQAIADEIGVELVVADQSFGGLITALRVGDIDIIASGMAIKPDRMEVVDFSVPYFSGKQILMVRAEDYDSVKTFDDMSGKVIEAQTGSLQAGILEEQFPKAKPQLMESVHLMMMDLLQGNTDGVLMTDLVAKNYIFLYPDKLAISDVPVVFNAEGSGIAVQKGDNASFLEVINGVITRVLSDGTFDEWIDEAVALNAKLLAE